MAGLKIASAARQAGAPSMLAARIAWEARRHGERLGWGAAVGACALAAAVLCAWQGQRLEARQHELAQSIAAARAAKPAQQRVALPDGARRVAAFYAWLPAHETIPDLLKQLVDVATKNGVVLAKADYKAQAEDGAAFMRYQITLPIKADYARVQAFIVGALRDMPALTLDSVTFKREQIDTGEVEARVHFNLLVRKAAAKGGRR
ncbi:type 4a pilus biogenesis protein PilO [Massilia rubra]|uniref:Type 4a pilus biogenesis protein PilO n=1 Tax=Massilia rubra TaxID=2607910 RepID=A0ABX0LF01_9BURK|nr:type 4a pilus biogenesis protein PilO [Massilia rubra]NHZ33173.1 type 4a pilus biogenesis protein PilO [Massilia rubra]